MSKHEFEYMSEHPVTIASFRASLKRAIAKQDYFNLDFFPAYHEWKNGTKGNNGEYIDFHYDNGNIAETVREKPYQFQSYIRTSERCGNYILEFDWYDEKTGFGYCYMIESDTTDTTDTTDTRKIKVTMFAGLNDGKTGVQIIPTNTAKQIVAEIACKYSNGATISECCGVWKTEFHLEIETSFRIEMLDFPLANVESMVNELKIALNQNSIAVEKGLIESNFM